MLNIIRFRKRAEAELYKIIGNHELCDSILKAVDSDIPIMICESEDATQIDGYLYGVLKRLGASKVTNIVNEIYLQNKISGVYLTVFNNYKP